MKTYKTQLGFDAVIFNDDYKKMDDEWLPILKHGTTTCAAGFLSIKNYHTYDEISEAINLIKKDSLNKQFNPANRDGGERLLLCTICEWEKNLRKNLIKLGFKKLTDFSRRKGYPDGNLELFGLTF